MTEGEFMPDFSTCIKDKNGDTWCIDRETGSVVKIVLEKPAINKIPQEVLHNLLQKEINRNNP